MAGLPTEAPSFARGVGGLIAVMLGMNKGFTIIEFLVVMSIFSVLISFSIFGFGSLEKGAKLRGATDQVSAKLNMVKQKAVSSSTAVELFCDSNSCKTRKLNIASNNFEETDVDPLPNGVHFDNTISFRFSSSGFPQPGYFGTATIKDGFGKAKKVVVSSVGRIRTE